ncbi:MAG: response regulator [Chitinophagaceae bacterium]
MSKFSKILLVDDDVITVMICKRMFQITDFADEVVSLTNGQDALNYIKNNLHHAEQLPDIIFIDLNMPVMNGWEFLERFKRLRLPENKMPIIYILSSTVDSSDQMKGLSYSFVKNFFSKPLTKEHLQNIKQKLLVS